METRLAAPPLQRPISPGLSLSSRFTSNPPCAQVPVRPPFSQEAGGPSMTSAERLALSCVDPKERSD
jgi:hypothetical protein